MLLEKTLARIKTEIKECFKSTPTIDMPGIAIIVNTENESIVNCTNILKEDCNEIGYNWFITNIDSHTSEEFIQRMIDDYIEMSEVTNILVILPFPENLKNIEVEIIDKFEQTNNKVNTLELVNGITTPGTRISILGITKEIYFNNKK